MIQELVGSKAKQKSATQSIWPKLLYCFFSFVFFTEADKGYLQTSLFIYLYIFIKKEEKNKTNKQRKTEQKKI